LKRASLPELVHRAKEAVFVGRLEGLWIRGGNPIRVPVVNPSDAEGLEMPSFSCEVEEDVLERVLQGEVFSLNSERALLRDFQEQHGHAFFARIKSSNTPPDIRAVWEPARLQHLSMVLVCFANWAKPKARDQMSPFVKGALLEWIGKNPFLLGPHYMSAMECGLRVPVLFYGLKCLHSLNSTERRQILETIYEHGWWISKRLSLYSSLGNHTIAECVGLLFAGAVYRETQEGRKWLDRGWGLLSSECGRQILGDGGPLEQSLRYHRFVLDLYWLAVDFLEKNKLRDCSDLIPRLKQGEVFLRAFEDERGGVPAIGDSDDGWAVAPDVFPKRMKPSDNFGTYEVFEKSGYTVIRSRNGIHLTFDHGPLGMPPLYNHGHADALSITLRKNGKAFLVDPGTYQYNGVPEWRKYFKGTRAHNTVTVDGLDQAVQETGFFWGKPYESKLTEAEERDGHIFLKAVHNGYRRLKDPVWHRRTILFSNGTTFLIKDGFSGKRSHRFELTYHLHPDALVNKEGGWWIIEHDGARIFMKLLDGQDFVVAKGQRAPLLGWYSPAYGIKEETTVLYASMTGEASNVSFRTVIFTEQP
jgi:hypothetical protein